MKYFVLKSTKIYDQRQSFNQGRSKGGTNVFNLSIYKSYDKKYFKISRLSLTKKVSLKKL